MGKLGSVAAAAGGLGLVTLALAGWTRPPAVQGGATISGKVKFTGKAPTNPVIDMNEEPKCKAKYTAPPREQIVEVNPNGTLAEVALSSARKYHVLTAMREPCSPLEPSHAKNASGIA